MFFKAVIFVSCCTLISQFYARTVESEPKYRTDYRYVPKQDAFYKAHKELRSWYDAHLLCDSEGGSLLYPKTKDEFTLLKSMAQEVVPDVNDVWVGANDLLAQGVFVDTDGIEISQNYAPWSPDRPTSGRSKHENCLEMELKSNGNLYNNNCYDIYPFVCKRLNRDVTFNSACQTPDPAFIPYKDGTRCYKVHKQPKSWTDAFSLCHVEQAYLSIINNKEEAEFITEQIKSAVDGVLNNLNKTRIAVGFHDRFKEGFYKTIHGQDLNSVYHEWSIGQPSSKHDREDCGALTMDGLLDDVHCVEQRMLYVCEREVEVNGEKQKIDEKK